MEETIPIAPRKVATRIEAAKSVQLRDAEPLQRIEQHLVKLANLVSAKGGFVCLSMEEDMPIAFYGNCFPDDYYGTFSEDALFTGESQIAEKFAAQPFQYNNNVVGYVGISFEESTSKIDLKPLLMTFAEVISKELELADKTATLEYQNEMISRKQRQLEQAISFKNSILSLTTHDLRSPLNAVTGFLSLMGEQIHGPEDLDMSEVKSFHRSMEKGLNAVNDLVEQLHEVALLELQKVDLQVIKVDINWVVQEVCDILMGPAMNKSQLLKFNRSQVPLYVEVDIPKVKRILFNLIGNALKYTPKGGRISVSLSRDNAFALIEITDTGIGIPSAKVNTIFEPFAKLKSSGTNGESSSGLGLFIANYITQLFKGSINVVSEEGNGTTFSLRLPLATGKF